MELEGQALHLVQGLPIITENYAIAWDLLVDRYEKWKMIVGLKAISKEDIREVRQSVNTPIL